MSCAAPVAIWRPGHQRAPRDCLSGPRLRSCSTRQVAVMKDLLVRLQERGGRIPVGRSFCRGRKLDDRKEDHGPHWASGWALVLAHLDSRTERPGPCLESGSACPALGGAIYPTLNSESDYRLGGKTETQIGASCSVFHPRALAYQGWRQGVEPRKSSCESAVGARGTRQGQLARDGCWPAVPGFHSCG